MAKDRRNRAAKNAGVTVAMSLLAGQAARFLARHSPEKVRDWIKNPEGILGIKVPPELATTLGGGAVGLTVVELLQHFVPGIGDNWLDYAQDFSVMVAEELDDELEKSGAPGTETTTPSNGGRRIIVKKNTWLVSSKMPTVVVLSDCSCAHQFDDTGKAKDDCRTITIERIIATGKHAPATPAEGFKDGCDCKAVLDDEIGEIKTAQAPKPASAPEPKGKGNAPSFWELMGIALKSSDATFAAKAEALRKLVLAADLTAAQTRQLEFCDNMDEFIALAACTTKAQLLGALPHLRAKSERSRWGEAGEQVQHGLMNVLDFGKWYRDGADARGNEAERKDNVEALCESYDVRLDEVFATLKPHYPDLKRNALTEDHVRQVCCREDGEDEAPVESYRKAQEQYEKQQAANEPKPGLLARMGKKLIFG